MLGVLKHTHNPVKFWFLKNYLSPTFKASVREQSCIVYIVRLDLFELCQ